MRIFSFLAALALLEGTRTQATTQDFAHCIPLSTPVGEHPGTGEELSAGYFEVTSDGDALVAKTVCNEDSGWVLTSDIFQEMRCEYDSNSKVWWWQHHHKNAQAPPQARCAHISPRPLIQRYNLGSQFEECRTVLSRLAFEAEIRQNAEKMLPCVAERECVVKEVQCIYDQSEGKSTLEVVLRSTALAHVDHQATLLNDAFNVIREVQILLNDEGSDRQKREGHRQKRFGDEMGDGETTGGSGCDDGEVESSDGDSCTLCSKGTFANTTSNVCESCDYDTFGNSTGLSTCYNCTSGTGTLDIASTNETDCIAICMVPTVELTTSLSPDSRAENEGAVTMSCDSGYTYGGASTATITCDTSLTNNNFPASCRSVSLEVTSSNYSSIEAGTNAVLSCENEATDVPDEITWWFGSTMLSNDSDYTLSAGDTATNGSLLLYSSTLTISTFADADTGAYSCAANYSSPISDDTSSELDLSIVDLTLSPTTTTYITAGDGTALTCEMVVDSNYASRSVTWYFDGSEVTSGITSSTDSDSEDFQLSLSSTTVNDTGTYTCIAQYSDSSGDNTISIEGQFDVVVRGFTTNPSDIYGDAGSSVTFSCTVQGDAEADITWYVTINSTTTEALTTFSGSASVDKDYDSMVTNSTLTLTGVTSSANDGDYFCSADFSGTIINSTTAALAVYDIGISSDPSDAAFSVGDTASLTCVVKNPSTLDADPSIEWIQTYNNGTEEAVSSDYVSFDGSNPTGTATLSFSSAVFANSGNYSCKATYVIGGTTVERTSDTAALYIRDLTTELDTNTAVDLNEASDYNFTCVYKGDDGVSPTVTWTLDGGALPTDDWDVQTDAYDDSTEMMQSVLEVTNLNKTSGGTVMCSFSFTNAGSAMTSSTNFKIRKLTALSTPMISNAVNYNITCVYEGTNDPASVSWSVGGTTVSSSDSGITIYAGSLSSNEREDVIEFSGRSYSDAEKNVTCKYTFSSPSDELTTFTVLKYRGISTGMSSNYYSTGDAVTLACDLGVGSDGSSPDITEWIGPDGDTISNGGDYAITTDSSATNGLFSTELVLSSISTDMAGAYTCNFTFTGDDNEYTSTGNVVVRLVTKDPSDTSIYSYENAELRLTCILDSSDSVTNVTWTGPSGVDVSNTTSSGDNYTLILNDPTSSSSGAYTCDFSYDAGTNPSETFSDVNVNLVDMTSPSSLYGTTDVSLTLTCQVTSPSEQVIYFTYGDNNLTADSIKYTSGVTYAYYTVDLDAGFGAKTYGCEMSADEYSTDTATITVLEMSYDFEDPTRSNNGTTVTLSCYADTNDAITAPTIAWYLGGSVTAETSDLTNSTTIGSGLEIDVDNTTDRGEYYCMVSYSGLANSTSLTSVTSTLIMNDIETDVSVAIVEASGSQDFVCTATADDTVDIAWRRGDGSGGYVDLTGYATQGAYDSSAGTRNSTLTLSSLMVANTSDSIECYDATIGIYEMMELYVVDVTDPADVGLEASENATFDASWSTNTDSATIVWYRWNTTDNSVDEMNTAELLDTDLSAGTSVLSENEIPYSMSGFLYGYTVTFTVDSVTLSVSSMNATLYVREFIYTLPTTTFIHYGEDITLSCSFSVENDAEISSTTWYFNGSAIDSSMFNNTYDSGSEMYKSVLIDDDVIKTDGGPYKCEFNFTVGDPMTSETDLSVHLLEPFNSSYINPTQLTCSFSGTNEPNFAWTDADGNDLTTLSTFNESVTSFTDYEMVSTLTIGDVSAAEDVTCAITFDDNSDSMNTTTNIQFRDFTSVTEDTYILGGALNLTCVFSFGVDGDLPDSANWTGITVGDGLYEIHNSNDPSTGLWTSILEFDDVNTTDYAQTYTCNFWYGDDESYQDSMMVYPRFAEISGDDTQYPHTNDGWSLTCDYSGADSDLPTGVTWSNDSGALTNGSGDFMFYLSGNQSTLDKLNPSDSDDSNYTCTFQFDTESSVTPTDNVEVDVSLLYFEQDTPFYVWEDDYYIFSCSFVDAADATGLRVFWYHEGSEITSGAPTYSNGVWTDKESIYTASEPGTWMCTLGNDYTANSTYNLELMSMDWISEPDGVSFEEDGVNATFSCVVNYDNSLADLVVSVQWLRQYTNATDSTTTSNEVVSSGSVDIEYASNYTSVLTVQPWDPTEYSYVGYYCNATISGDNFGSSTEYGPYRISTKEELMMERVYGVPSSMALNTGSTFEISCTAVGAEGTTIEWYEDSSNITTQSTSTSWDSSSYSIVSTLNVTYVDADATYYCVHQYEGYRIAQNDSMDLDVYDTTTAGFEVLSGTTVTLECNVTGSEDTITFQWSNSTDDLSTTRSYTDGDTQATTLEITTGSSDQRYTCTITDADGDDIMDYAWAKIYEIEAENIKSTKGSNATISCIVSDLSSDVTIVFNNGTDDLASEAGVYTFDAGSYSSGDVNKTATLMVHEIQEDAEFTCKVISVDFPDSEMAEAVQNITVYDVTVTPLVAIIEDGEYVEFTCVAVGDSSIDIVWTPADTLYTLSSAIQDAYDDSTGTRTSVLTITNAPTSYSIDWTCTVDFGTDSVSEVTRLEVVDLVAPSETTKVAGEDIVLTCTYTEVDSQPTVTWYQMTDSGNMTVSSDLISSSSGESYLTISNVNKTDNGEIYFCSFDYAIDDVAEQFNTSTATIYVRDIETDINEVRVIKFGDSVFLECTVYGDSGISVEWFFDDSSYSDNIMDSDYDSSTYSLTSNLTVSSVDDANNGNFTCAHGQNTSALMIDFKVDVYNISTTNLYHENGTDTTIVCEVIGLDSAVTLTWSDSEGDINTTVLSTDGTLNSTVSPTFDHTYTCELVSNSYDGDNTTSTATLDVFEIELSSDVYTGQAGSTFSISCTVSDATADGTSWYKSTNSTDVLSSSSELEFTAPLEDDMAGDYYCMFDMGEQVFMSEDVAVYVRTLEVNETVVVNTDTDSSVYLTCLYYGDNDGIANITWTDEDGNVLQSGASTSVTTMSDYLMSTLYVSGLDPTTSGHTYTVTFNFTSGPGLSEEIELVMVDIPDFATYTYDSYLYLAYSGTYEPTITWMINGSEYVSASDTWAQENTIDMWGSNMASYALNFTFDVGEGPYEIYANVTLSAVSDWSYATNTATVFYRGVLDMIESATLYDSDFPYSLQCTSFSEDADIVTIDWFIDNKKISEETYDYIEITNATSGYYHNSTLEMTRNWYTFSNDIKCRATWDTPSGAPTVSYTSDLNAVGAYMASSSFSDGDDNGIMDCIVWGDDAPFNVTWFQDGVELETLANTRTVSNVTSGSKHTYTLTIISMTYGDQGNYTCSVEYTDGGTTETYVTELFRISASFSPDSPYFVHDGKVTFTCVYTGVNDPYDVKWYLGEDSSGTLIEEDDDSDRYTIATGSYSTVYSTRDSVFSIENATVTDTANYTCIWNTSTFDPSATMLLKLRSLSIGDATQYSLDANMTLSCLYEGTSEFGAMTWSYEGSELSPDGSSLIAEVGDFVDNTINYTLTIVNARPEDNAGSYTCALDFNDGDSISSTTDLVVRRATIITVTGTPMANIVVDGDELEARCQFLGATAPGSVEWYNGTDQITFDGTTSIQNTNTRQLTSSIEYFSNITIKSFDASMAAEYTCKFITSDGNDPEVSVNVLVASVSNDECVFVDLAESTEQNITCDFSSTGSAEGVFFTLPNGSVYDGDLWGSVGSLVISDLSSDSDGTYSCAFDIGGGESVSAVQRLVAREAVVSTSQDSNSLNLLSGSTVSFTCNITGGAKSASWFKDDAAFSDYTEITAEAITSSDLFMMVIEVDVADSSAADYVCQGAYYDDYCPTEQYFNSSAITLDVISATPLTQPSSAVIVANKPHTITCVFPNPYGTSVSYEITWSYNGKNMMSNGDYYSSGSLYINGSVADDAGSENITTTLTLDEVDSNVIGDYVCTIKWGTIYIKSSAASIDVNYFSTSASTTNVITGGSATFTCITESVAQVSSVELYDSSMSIVGSSATSNSQSTYYTATTTITLDSVDSSDAGYYYCNATFDEGNVVTDSVYLNVFEINDTLSTSTAWGVKGLLATFEVVADQLLRSDAEGDALTDSSGDSIYATMSIAWEYYDDDSDNWASIDDVSRYRAGTTTAGTTGLSTSPLTIGPVRIADDGLIVKAILTYDDDSSNNFFGGSITSSNMTLSLADISNFNASDDSPIEGSTITFSCTATGDSEPTFTFFTSGSTMDSSRFEYVSGPTTTQDGDSYTAVYVTKPIIATVLNSGQKVYCEADYGTGSGSVTKSYTVTTYYNCSDVSITSLGASGVEIIDIEYYDNGTTFASVSCPADSDSVRYDLQTTSRSEENATCTKETGYYDPGYLASCGPQYPFTTGYVEKTWYIKSYGIDVCTSTPTGANLEYNKVNMIAKMTNENETVCGPSVVAPCLISGNCTLVTDDTSQTGCKYKTRTGKLSVFYTVEFNFTIWSKTERNAMKDPISALKWYSCSETYDETMSKRKRALEESSLLLSGKREAASIVDFSNLVEEAIDTEIEHQDEILDLVDPSTTTYPYFMAVGAVAGIATIAILISAVFFKKRRTAHTPVATEEA